MNSYEYYVSYYDAKPHLNSRKKCWYIWIIYSHICYLIAKNSLFSLIMFIIIVFNTLELMSLDPFVPYNLKDQKIELFFLAVYTFEMVIKMSGFGLFTGREAYFKDS